MRLKYLFITLDIKSNVDTSYFHSNKSFYNDILLWGSALDMNTAFVFQKRANREMYAVSFRNKINEINIINVPCQYIYYNKIKLK